MLKAKTLYYLTNCVFLIEIRAIKKKITNNLNF